MFKVGKDQRQQVVINTNRERYKNAVSLNAVTSQISSLNNCMHIIIQSLSIYILIEIQLVCNVVLISGVEQSDSDTYIYMCIYILFLILFCYGLLQNTEYNSLWSLSLYFYYIVNYALLKSTKYSLYEQFIEKLK